MPAKERGGIQGSSENRILLRSWRKKSAATTFSGRRENLSFDKRKNFTMMDAGEVVRRGPSPRLCTPLLMLNRGYVALVNNMFGYMLNIVCIVHMGAGPTQQARGLVWGDIKYYFYSLLFPREEKPINQGGRDRERDRERQRDRERDPFGRRTCIRSY